MQERIMGVAAAVALALSGCASGGGEAGSTASSTSSSSTADTDQDSSKAKDANAAKRKSMESFGPDDGKAAASGDPTFAHVTDLLDPKDPRWDGWCNDVEKRESKYNGKPYEELTCWDEATDAQVTAQTGEIEDDWVPDETLQALYFGNGWVMAAETKYVLKKFLPKGSDPRLIVTYDDVMELSE